MIVDTLARPPTRMLWSRPRREYDTQLSRGTVITTTAQSRAVDTGEGVSDADSESDCPRTADYAAVEQVAIQLLRPWRRKIQLLVGDTRGFLRSPVRSAVADLHCLTDNDPAGQGDWRHVLAAYVTYQAVLAYRIAHTIAGVGGAEARTLARCLSERAKVDTGVEIHPHARIGPRLVVDHGMGTVIGETAVIGADCYLLQGVVLGATGICGNLAKKRHPTLGDRVQVGGFARILGPVEIGDDVVIGCHTLVRQDVPAGSRVTMLHQYQIVSGSSGMSVDDVELIDHGRLRLRGMNLDTPGLTVQLLGPDHESLGQVTTAVRHLASEQLVLDIEPPVDGSRTTSYVRLADATGASITVSVPFVRTNSASRARPPANPAPSPTDGNRSHDR
jgi:serine O-acetyltransferase